MEPPDWEGLRQLSDRVGVGRLPEENTKEEVAALAALVDLIPGEATVAVAAMVGAAKLTGAVEILPMDAEEVDVFCACRRLTGVVVLSAGEVCRIIGMRGTFSSGVEFLLRELVPISFELSCAESTGE